MFDFNSKLMGFPEKITQCTSDEIQNSLSTVFLDLVSGICNHDCIFCDGKYNFLPKKMFEKKRLFEMITELKRLGTNSVIIVGEGGESTLHPNFKEFALELIKEGFHLGLYTNGCTNLDDAIDVLVQFDFIRISMDSGTTNMHYIIHGGEKEDLNKLLKFASVLIKCGAKNVGFSYIIMEENSLDIYNAVNLAQKIGVDYIEFKPYYAKGYRLDMHSKEVILDALEELREYVHDKKIKTKVIFNNQFKEIIEGKTEIESLMRTEPRKCHTSKLRMVVSPTGCYLCTCFRNNDEYYMGNPNIESLIDIWYGKKHYDLLSKTCCYRCTYDVQNEMLNKIKENGCVENLRNLSVEQKYFL